MLTSQFVTTGFKYIISKDLNTNSLCTIHIHDAHCEFTKHTLMREPNKQTNKEVIIMAILKRETNN